ncbi:MAG: response regulator transcription factor, partial [Desulfuromonadales bacterium]|nr:response regulator transcription factor [Desulfuromonadales bacterium]NIS40929.1 response regulator transcription factor [Desulfuromonadales bacterium]
MNKDRVLAIEDDEGVCRLLRHSLAREDYDVRIAYNGEDGLVEAIDDPPDLFLLDLDLPGMDGLAVCQELKKNPATRTLPIIILTGKGEESDVVQGLEMGADDYIVKPFSPKILNARLQAVLRRRTLVDTTTAAAAEVIEFGPLVVDTSSNTIR